jgi:hypothetical protein
MPSFTGAFSGFSATDIGAERTFYSTLLGATVEDGMGGILVKIGGQRVYIYPKEGHEPATFTVLNFETGDIEAAVDDLSAAGIVFERYDGFDQDERGIERGIGPPIAWFKDPAGNILSMVQTS